MSRTLLPLALWNRSPKDFRLSSTPPFDKTVSLFAHCSNFQKTTQHTHTHTHTQAPARMEEIRLFYSSRLDSQDSTSDSHAYLLRTLSAAPSTPTMSQLARIAEDLTRGFISHEVEILFSENPFQLTHSTLRDKWITPRKEARIRWMETG